MKALKVLNYIYFELNKNNTKGVWIEPKIIKEAKRNTEHCESTKQEQGISKNIWFETEGEKTTQTKITHSKAIKWEKRRYQIYTDY